MTIIRMLDLHRSSDLSGVLATTIFESGIIDGGARLWPGLLLNKRQSRLRVPEELLLLRQYF
jgi:hypothetical protein